MHDSLHRPRTESSVAPSRRTPLPVGTVSVSGPPWHRGAATLAAVLLSTATRALRAAATTSTVSKRSAP